MSDIPENLRYTKDHEWARVEDDGLVVVGITAHAVEQLGDITMVTLPEVGSITVKDEQMGDIDSVKAVSELFAPIDGEVVEVNAEIDDAPEKINEEPYGAGWMLKLKPADPAQLDTLMDAKAYGELIAD